MCLGFYPVENCSKAEVTEAFGKHRAQGLSQDVLESHTCGTLYLLLLWPQEDTAAMALPEHLPLLAWCAVTTAINSLWRGLFLPLSKTLFLQPLFHWQSQC